MTQPLALVLYEKLLPATQLVNRLQDLGYRVRTVNDPALLSATAEETMPLIVFADLDFPGKDVLQRITELREKSKTSHLPVIAFTGNSAEEGADRVKAAGVTLLTNEAALTNHLPQLLEQALRID